MYYLRARYYDPLNGRFNQLDPYAGNNQDPQSLHKYLYCHANPVNGIDPSGESEVLEVNISMAIGVMLIGMMACTVLNPVWRQASAQVFGGIISELRDLAAFGGAAAIAAYNAVASNMRIVAKAIDEAAKALKKTVRELQKFKFFPVIKSLTPAIFAFNVAALATHPYWFMLEYNGAGNYLTDYNRLWVASRYGYMMITAPPGYQLDEFPYACTAQGGPGGPALACPVPAWENALQGGYLGAFTRWTLKGITQPFIVVPIPI